VYSEEERNSRTFVAKNQLFNFVSIYPRQRSLKIILRWLINLIYLIIIRKIVLSLSIEENESQKTENKHESIKFERKIRVTNSKKSRKKNSGKIKVKSFQKWTRADHKFKSERKMKNSSLAISSASKLLGNFGSSNKIKIKSDRKIKMLNAPSSTKLDNQKTSKKGNFVNMANLPKSHILASNENLPTPDKLSDQNFSKIKQQHNISTNKFKKANPVETLSKQNT
jgi:hypothetical protein